MRNVLLVGFGLVLFGALSWSIRGSVRPDITTLQRVHIGVVWGGIYVAFYAAVNAWSRFGRWGKLSEYEQGQAIGNLIGFVGCVAMVALTVWAYGWPRI